MKFEFLSAPKAPIYNSVSQESWHSWLWQMQNTLKDEKDFSQVFSLESSEQASFDALKNIFRVATTPYYASLATQSLSLRKILMPTAVESDSGAQQMLDPLAEDIHSPYKRIVHRYSDRVLFLVTDHCGVYCRYCTRKRFTGGSAGFAHGEEYQQALNYIRTHRGIREVILSGGDPFTLSNNIIDKILRDVRSIEHVEIIRIGSRMPVVNPSRVDKELVMILREYKPIYMMTHFNHPKELTQEAVEGLSLFVDHGVPVFNQMVLLNGVNNHPAIVQALSRRLLYLRVKPYYMFQCDPSEGTDHLRTTVESSEQIVRELWGHLSGLAMPTLSLDIPDGGGKTSLVPNFEISRESGIGQDMRPQKGIRKYQGWDGRVGEYRNPEVAMQTPQDACEYEAEWNEIKSSKN